MENKPLRKIVFEDGTEICGKGFGTSCEKVCELVFNTSVVGYQETYCIRPLGIKCFLQFAFRIGRVIKILVQFIQETIARR